MWIWILRGLQTGGRVSARWLSRFWGAPIKAAGAVGTRVGGIIGAWRGAGSAAAYVTRIWEARTAMVFSEVMKFIQVTGAGMAAIVGLETAWNNTAGKALGYLSSQGSKYGSYVIFIGVVYFAAQLYTRRK